MPSQVNGSACWCSGSSPPAHYPRATANFARTVAETMTMIVTKTVTVSAPGAVVENMDTEGRSVECPHGDPAGVASSRTPIVPKITEAASHSVQRAQPTPLTSRAASESAQQVCGPQPSSHLPAHPNCSLGCFSDGLQSAVQLPVRPHSRYTVRIRPPICRPITNALWAVFINALWAVFRLSAICSPAASASARQVYGPRPSNHLSTNYKCSVDSCSGSPLSAAQLAIIFKYTL